MARMQTQQAKTQQTKLKELVGKTIEAIDNSASNCVNVRFTDGTCYILEAENVGHGIYGIIGYKIKQ